MTHGLPLLLSLEAPTAATSCSSRYVFMRPQTGQEKIWLLCFLLFPWEVFLPPPCLQEQAEQMGPPAPARGRCAHIPCWSTWSRGGRAEGWIWLRRAQIPLPLPLFELLVAVLAAEAPAFPSPVPHVSAAAGIAVAQAFCCRQRGLLRHVWGTERSSSEAQGRTAGAGDICLAHGDTRQHLLDGGTHPISATMVPLP